MGHCVATQHYYRIYPPPPPCLLLCFNDSIIINLLVYLLSTKFHYLTNRDSLKFLLLLSYINYTFFNFTLCAVYNRVLLFKAFCVRLRNSTPGLSSYQCEENGHIMSSPSGIEPIACVYRQTLRLTIL